MGHDRSDRRSKKHLFSSQSVDLDASMRSNVSVNSWMDDDRRRNSRRELLMQTATKLSKKLAYLDRNGDKSREVKKLESDYRRARSQSLNRNKNKNKKSYVIKKSRSVTREPNNLRNSRKDKEPWNNDRAESSITGLNHPPMRF